MSRNTVSKYVQLLVDKELITAEPTSIFTKGNKKLNGNLLYTILPIEQAKHMARDYLTELYEQFMPIVDLRLKKRFKRD